MPDICLRTTPYSLTNAAVTEVLRTPSPKRTSVTVFNTTAAANVLVAVTDGSKHPTVANFANYQVKLIVPGADATIVVGPRNRVFLIGSAAATATVLENGGVNSVESNLLPVGVPKLFPIDGANQGLQTNGSVTNLLAGNGGTRRKAVKANNGPLWLVWTGYYNVTGSANDETLMANGFRIYSAGFVVFNDDGSEAGRYMAEVPMDNSSTAPYMGIDPGDLRAVQVPYVPLRAGQWFEPIWHWRVSAVGQVCYSYGDCDTLTEFAETFAASPVDKVTNTSTLPAPGNGYHYFAPMVFSEEPGACTGVLGDSTSDQPRYMPSGNPHKWGWVALASQTAARGMMSLAASSWLVGLGAENNMEQMGIRMRLLVSTCQSVIFLGGANDILNPPSGGATQVFNVWANGVRMFESYLDLFGIEMILATNLPAGMVSSNFFGTAAGQTAYVSAYWKQMVSFIRARTKKIDLVQLLMDSTEQKYPDAPVIATVTLNASGGNVHTTTRVFFDTPPSYKYGDLHNYGAIIGGVYRLITVNSQANGQNFFDVSTVWGVLPANGNTCNIIGIPSVDGTHQGADADRRIGLYVGEQLKVQW